MPTRKHQADAYELLKRAHRVSDARALLELEQSLQTSVDCLEQSQVLIARADERLEQSAERLLRSQTHLSRSKGLGSAI